ncbi:MAG: glycosyltransferase [Verrucomicrobiota bacterium]
MGSSPHRTANVNRPKVLYLCTTFPRLSETFVEREVRHLSSKVPLQVISLWKGHNLDGIEVEPIRFHRLLSLVFHLPYWLARNPRGLVRILQQLLGRFPRSFLNLQETLLGMGMGVLLAKRVSKEPPLWIHGVWATAPATTALTLHLLTGSRFSFGAHAYDLFQNGGDCLLAEKIRYAAWIRTSTLAAAKEIERRGASRERVFVIRRGLEELPDESTPRETREPLHLVSVGRLVPKKGHHRFLKTCRLLSQRKVEFTAELIGDGPLRKSLDREIKKYHLNEQVALTGALPHEEVSLRLARADLFLFTGGVSEDGNRDGLPNVLPEAMAHGIPVLTTPVEGALEAIKNGETGIVLEAEDPEAWVAQILDLWRNHRARKTLAENARQWVEANFLTAMNTGQLVDLILASSSDPSPKETVHSERCQIQ